MATKLPREYLLSPDFDPIRKFIVNGQIGKHAPLCIPEYRNIYMTHQAMQEFFHRVTVYCSKLTRNVVGLVELFGHIRIAVVISWQYEGRDRAYCLIEYPTERRHQEYEISRFTPVPTRSIMLLTSQEREKARCFLERSVKELAAQLEEHNMKVHFREVLKDCVTELFCSNVHYTDLEEVLPKIVSCFTQKSNYATLKVIAEKYPQIFLQILYKTMTDNLTLCKSFKNHERIYVEKLQKLIQIQCLIDLLMLRIQKASCLGQRV